MARVRRIPEEYEVLSVAKALGAAARDWKQLPQWLRDAYERGDVIFGNQEVFIRAPSGEVRVKLGDWILRDSEGELWWCSGEGFHLHFEPVQEHPDGFNPSGSGPDPEGPR